MKHTDNIYSDNILQFTKKEKLSDLSGTCPVLAQYFPGDCFLLTYGYGKKDDPNYTETTVITNGKDIFLKVK